MSALLETGASWRFCKAVLPKVSRTFALNIGYLSGEIHRAVLSGYLLCRILDTVEDAPDREADFKVPLLRAFPAFLTAPPEAGALRSWKEEALKAGMKPAERTLLENADAVLAVFHALSAPSRTAMVQPVTRMAHGMAETLERRASRQSRQLRDLEDLERYCYFVAGTVGEFLTALFLERIPARARREILEREKLAFALGLQLTNILKDIRADRGRAWCYIPADAMAREGLSLEAFWSWENPAANRRVMTPLAAHTARVLRRALAYTLALPLRQQGMRLFCAVPLMLAVETLAVLAPGLGRADAPVKITRATVRAVLLRARLFCLVSPLLRHWTERRLALIDRALGAA